MSQTVNVPAGSYKVSFKVAQAGGSQTLAIKADGTTVGTVTPASTSYADYFTAPISVTSGSHTLSIEGTTFAETTALIDSVELKRVGPAASVPARSATALVTSYAYDDAGRLRTTTDPRGLASKTFYDMLGRTTKTVANYVDGTPSQADDQTTQYTYDGDDHVLTMKAVNVNGSGTSNQITGYVYNSTTNVFSNDLLTAVQYPDKTTGAASSGEQETFIYNALGERTKYTDRNGSVHDYSYDVLDRLTTDNVSTLGSGVDGSVRKLGYTFNTQGLPEKFTSYNSSGTVVNEVLRQYNGLGQLTKEYQTHSGAVNTSTSPKVQYAYSEMASGANHSRLTSMTYPNGRVITYDYGTASGLNDKISRLSALKDGSTTLEWYGYLGLSTVIQRLHSQGAVDLTYKSSTTIGSAGDPYVGLDSFGRVIDQKWVNESGTAVDEYQYGYDNDGNRLYRKNTLSATNSELYTYDGLNRLSSMTRGTLNSGNTAITGTPTYSESWNFDAEGNWDGSSGVTTNGTAQTRAHNAQNQITTIGSNTPTYDSNGNTLTDGLGHTYSYDAWNRMHTGTDGTTTETFGNDALGRKVSTNDGTTTTDHFYSTQWQVLEDDRGGHASNSYVWSPVYIDAMVERDRDSDNDTSHTLDERLYATQDANWNVTSVLTTSGTVVERFNYTAYGAQNVLNASTWASSTDSYMFAQRYQGGFSDDVAGVTQFDYRLLSPTLGRWTQEDPQGYIDGQNLYTSFHDSPEQCNDPIGLSATTNPTTQPSPAPGVRINTRLGVWTRLLGVPIWLPINHAWIECVSSNGQKHTISRYTLKNDLDNSHTVIGPGPAEAQGWDYNSRITQSIELPIPPGMTLDDYIAKLLKTADAEARVPYMAVPDDKSENCTTGACRIVNKAGGSVPPFDPIGIDDFPMQQIDIDRLSGGGG